MMTPQLYLKLKAQIARQTPEAAALEAQAAALQPAIDSAQAWLDSCNAALVNAQALLTEAQAVEGADTTTQQEAVNAAQASVEAAKSDLSKATGPQKSTLDHAQQIRTAMAQCQTAIDASGIMQADVDTYLSAESAAQASAAEQARIASLWQAAHDVEFAAISGVAVGLLVMGVLQQKPVSLAIKAWVNAIWSTYYARKFSGSTDTDFSVVGPCPHSIPEMMSELGV